MEFLRENWFWILLIGGFFWMHSRGHGCGGHGHSGHGGHSGHDGHEDHGAKRHGDGREN